MQRGDQHHDVPGLGLLWLLRHRGLVGKPQRQGATDHDRYTDVFSMSYLSAVEVEAEVGKGGAAWSSH